MVGRERLTELFLKDPRTAGPNIIGEMSGKLPGIAVIASEPDPKKWDNDYVLATATALVAHRRENDPFLDIRPELDYLEDFSADRAHWQAIQKPEDYDYLNPFGTLGAAYWSVYDNLDGLEVSEKCRVSAEFIRCFAIQSIADRVSELPNDNGKITHQLCLIGTDHRLLGNPERQLDYHLTRFVLERRAELSRAQMCQLVSMCMALDKAILYDYQNLESSSLVDLTEFSHLEPDLTAELIQYLEDSGIQDVQFAPQPDGSQAALYELRDGNRHQESLLTQMLVPHFRAQLDRYEELSSITGGRFSFEKLFSIAERSFWYSKDEPADDIFRDSLARLGLTPEEIKQISDLISEE